MRNISNGIMTILLLMVCVVACQSYQWIAEPEIRAENPLPRNTPVYIYFSSRMAGLKNDNDPGNLNKPMRNYVLLAVVLNGKTEVNTSWDYYRDVEYRSDYYAKKNIWGQPIEPFDLDGLIAGMAKGYFKKYVPDKKYFWIKPEGQKDVIPDPGHLILGRGRVLWSIWYKTASNTCYSDECKEAKEKLGKKNYPELASYALAHGSNVAIITDCTISYELDKDGKIMTKTYTTEKVTYYTENFQDNSVAWMYETDDLRRAKYKKTKTTAHEDKIENGYEYDVLFMRFEDLLSNKQ
jgi:hypothetical protein